MDPLPLLSTQFPHLFVGPHQLPPGTLSLSCLYQWKFHRENSPHDSFTSLMLPQIQASLPHLGDGSPYDPVTWAPLALFFLGVGGIF